VFMTITTTTVLPWTSVREGQTTIGPIKTITSLNQDIIALATVAGDLEDILS
jgi:hypothetical protein